MEEDRLSPPPAAGDHELKWRRFSRSIVGVLTASILMVAGTIATISAFRILDLAKSDEVRKAHGLARIVARTAFVPLSLENESMLSKAINVYLDDPDLVFVRVRDAAGKVVYEKELRKPPKPSELVSHESLVRSRDDGGVPVGNVEIGLSMERAIDSVWRSIWVITASALALLAVAIALGLGLIQGMTNRLQELVGEARLAQELAQVNAELEAFSYSVSHDLRAPLRHIDGFIQMLEKRSAGALDEQGKRYVGIIAGSSKRMGTLIDDLLAFSRTSRVQMRHDRVSLRLVVDQVVSEFKAETEGRDLEVRIQSLPEVEGDESLLRQVYANLIGNAIKFTGKTAKGLVEVGGQAGARGMAELYVRDNGAGFDPKYADKLFGVFQRLHSREEFEGTGIGLANVKRIIDRHGGSIRAESEPGKGATFFFTLPLSRKREAVS